jgi:2-polyprenyl-3-methyl-5-hydroxy-6-metoxy-1,4-benzoquinol methylase
MAIIFHRTARMRIPYKSYGPQASCVIRQCNERILIALLESCVSKKSNPVRTAQYQELTRRGVLNTESDKITILRDSTRMRLSNTLHMDTHRLRILVAIASYGEKNLGLLKHIIGTYRSMAFDVHVVVFSEAPKDLGAQVEVVVGLPSRNPWTLPFAHKAIFAQRVDRYDLFVYSEDDIGVTEANIRAFLNATPQLGAHEIAGFFRYEVDPSGKWYVNEPWNHYHWKPESVRRRGTYTIAEFTNEHAGFYILTQSQLKRAIASGGFLRGPCKGRYDWPETAATDPYTNCGFRKAICISSLEDFLVHHMSNRYAAQLDVSLASFKEQIQALMDIRDGIRPGSTLWAAESKLWPSGWPKAYYEKPSDELLKLVPGDAQTVLSVGCGWGAMEVRLKERGAKVTALPLDSVIGAVAERRGIHVIYGTWDDCFRTLDGRRFDCVIMTNLLHLQANPRQLIENCSRFTREGGSLILGGPNFDRLPWSIRRILGNGEFGKLRSFDLSGVSVCGPKTLAKMIQNASLRVTDVHWLNHTINWGWLRGSRMPLGSLTARDWVLQARR